MNVCPHPHVGLATVTYLIEGSIYHRHTLGSSEELIVPGDVNWMSAGRASFTPNVRTKMNEAETANLCGLQLWVALPERFEESVATFAHYEKRTFPAMGGDGVFARLIAGQAFGMTSPASTLSDLFQVDVQLQSGARLAVDTEHEERAIYLLQGRLEVDGFMFKAGRLQILAPARQVVIRAAGANAHLLLLGSEPMEGPRYIWWTSFPADRNASNAPSRTGLATSPTFLCRRNTSSCVFSQI